jgi:hypothetical protein
MEKVSKFTFTTVLQKIWILIYGIKNSVFLDADTSISVKPPISTLLCPKHGVLLESLVYICQYTESYIPQAAKLLIRTGHARTHAAIRQPLTAEA